MIYSPDEYFQKTRKTTDLTKNGKCCGCGECCGSILPLTEADIDRIKRYIKKNNIRPHAKAAILTASSMDITCPFLDTTKTSDKCMIYSVRPMICRNFICNKPDRIHIKAFANNIKNMRPVDMWDIAKRGVGNGQ